MLGRSSTWRVQPPFFYESTVSQEEIIVEENGLTVSYLLSIRAPTTRPIRHPIPPLFSRAHSRARRRTEEVNGGYDPCGETGHFSLADRSLAAHEGSTGSTVYHLLLHSRANSQR